MDEETFRQNAAAGIMMTILDHPDKIVTEYQYRDGNCAHMDIYEFTAMAAVNYTDALIKKLKE